MALALSSRPKRRGVFTNVTSVRRTAFFPAGKPGHDSEMCRYDGGDEDLHILLASEADQFYQIFCGSVQQ